MRFRKFQGTGNDFVMAPDLAGELGPPGALPPELVSALCDRHTGIGADGVIRIIGADADPEAAEAGAALRMDYYNADGLPAEMCGNGIRCLAILARDSGWIEPGTHTVLTRTGPRAVRIGADEIVAVDMGVPSLEREDVPLAGEGPALRVAIELPGDGTVEGTGVSMGNPHFVLFSDDLEVEIDDALVHGLGPRLETHAAFPQRTNVEFVDVVSPDEIAMRVWERGVGETMACGSGACAAAVASAALSKTKRRVTVRVPGGTLEVDWASDGLVWLTGPAEEVFSGEVDEGWLRARGL